MTIPRAQRGQPTGVPAPTGSMGTAAARRAASPRGRAPRRRELLALHREARGLCALQLAARGYSVDQMAALRDVPATEVARDLGGAVRSLGAASVRGAVHVALRRGLLL